MAQQSKEGGVTELKESLGSLDNNSSRSNFGTGELGRICAEEEIKSKFREQFYPFALQIVEKLWMTTSVIEGIDMNPFRAEYTAEVSGSTRRNTEMDV